MRIRVDISIRWATLAAVVAAIGTGIALAVSENVRKRTLDVLFGAEEEFEYSSTTTEYEPGLGGAGMAPGVAVRPTVLPGPEEPPEPG